MTAKMTATEKIERRLSSIALGRVKTPKPPTVAEQLKAAELLLRRQDENQPAAAPTQKPLEVCIRVLDAAGKEVKQNGT